MNITLPAELESYIKQSVQSGAFASPREFVEAAARRQMQEEAWFEQKVLESLEGPVTPLTREDLDSVRNFVRCTRDR
jgi:Arc/MetJ-type ribon-helix-helix transcriptional regulator